MADTTSNALVWDQTGDRRYESGTDHGVLYPMVNNEYPKGIAWSGLTGYTESPSGAEATDMWADNIKYASPRSAEKFGSTIEAFQYPDEWEECDGSAQVAKGVTFGQQKRKAFGFVCRTNIGTDSDASAGYKLHLQYNSTASPSERAHKTENDSPEGMTMSWTTSATAVPVTVKGSDGKPLKPVAHIEIDSTKTDPVKLAKLESILFGGEKPARLPLPDEVYQLMADSAVNPEG